MEYFYTRLFAQLLGDSVKIERVIGVGGKDRVLKIFKLQRNNPKNAREFYLVDGDFDALIGIYLASDPRLDRLARYDIEGYLIEPNAISTIAQEQNPEFSKEHYLRRLDFRRWQESLAKCICRLIACHALLHSLKTSPQGARTSIERFTSGSDHTPHPDGIHKYIDEHRDQQCSLSPEAFDRELREIMNRMGGSSSHILRLASGKKILFPLVIRFLKRETGQNITVESLRFRLVPHCRLDDLSELTQAIVDFQNKGTVATAKSG